MKKLLLLFILSMTAVLSAQVKVSEFYNGKVRCVKVENSFYSVIITPQIGGKILQYYDKITKTQLTKLKTLPTYPISRSVTSDFSMTAVTSSWQITTAPSTPATPVRSMSH